MSECLQTFLVFSHSAPRHSVAVHAARHNMLLVEFQARDRPVMTV